MTKRIVLALAVVAGLFVAASSAQEAVTLTTPIAKTATSACALDTLLLDVTNSTVAVTLKCNNGDSVGKRYDSTTTPTGAALLTALNRANFTTNSLIKAVFNRLLADGVIPAGSITGTPQ